MASRRKHSSYLTLHLSLVRPHTEVPAELSLAPDPQELGRVWSSVREPSLTGERCEERWRDGEQKGGYLPDGSVGWAGHGLLMRGKQLLQISE